MKKLLFPEKSSSESETESDSENEEELTKQKPAVPIHFRCAPQPHKRKGGDASQNDEIFIIDTNAATSNIEVTTTEQTLPEKPSLPPTEPKKSRKKNKKKAKSSTPKSVAATSDELFDHRIKDLLAKSAIQPGFEKLSPNEVKPKSLRAQKRERKAARESTKGEDWFGLPATELTEEKQRDLEIIQMRDALDTKTHYKKNDRSVLPKYFQVGTIIETKADFYSSRLPKKQRKRTIVEELMADEEFRSKQRKKYEQLKALEVITRKGAFRRLGYPKKKRTKVKHS